MNILGYNYLVENNDAFVELDTWFGLHKAKNLQLLIRSDLCTEQKISTVLHEIIEALNFHLQLKLEHTAITGLEAGLYQVLTENGIDLAPLAKDVLNDSNTL